MSTRYLGLSGSEVLLPQIRYRQAPPGLAVEASPSVEKTTMLDGSIKANIRPNRSRRFPLEWDMLTLEEFNTIKAIEALRRPLRYQDNWEGTDWINVVITAFSPERIISTSTPGLVYYQIRMTLEEIG